MPLFKKYQVLKVDINNSKGIKQIDLSDGFQCELHGYWFNTIIKKDDLVAIRTNCIKDKLLQITNSHGMIVVNPDILITSTTLSNANFCLRKSWLNEKFRTSSIACKPFLIGNIVHSLFQKSCTKNFTSLHEYLNELDLLLQNNEIIKEIIQLNENFDEIKKEVYDYIKSIVQFKKKYFQNQLVTYDPNYPDKKIKFKHVRDIEECFYDINYGIKGKIDITLEVEICAKNEKKLSLIPLEIKTGRHSNSIEHQAQVSLYTMMMENQNNFNNFGLLLYLKDDPTLKHVSPSIYIKKSLIQQRNELVAYSLELERGPEVKNNIRICSKCEHLIDCNLMSKCFDPDIYKTISNDLTLLGIGHLQDNHIKFFKNWTQMCFYEARLEKSKISNEYFWNFKSEEQEKNGLGIGKLIIESQDENKNRIVFIRNPNDFNNLGLFNVDILGKKITNKLLISIVGDNDELERIAFNSGYLKSITAYKIEAILEKNIKKDFEQKIFRIDFPLYENSSVVNNSNILRLMENNEIASKLRKIIIDKEKSTFEKKIDKSHLENAKKILNHLNVDQQKAVLKTLLTNQYLLIKGNPGSGKTETIIALVRMLFSMGKSIIITSHTNVAVDNILLKLKDLKINFIRIGNIERIHQDIQEFSEYQQILNLKKIEETKKFYDSFKIIGSTCLSLNSHTIFRDKKFDYCIMDEASQVIFPTSIIPLFNSDKFILVGDPKQLPPVVRSNSAKKLGFDQTLFTMLQEKDNTVELNIQYRMNSEIMRIANEFTYNGKLKCANHEISNQVIEMNQLKFNSYGENEADWLTKVLSDKKEDSAFFLNTDFVEAKHERDTNGFIYNVSEVMFIQKILTNFIRNKIDQKNIGIIAPYQKQVEILKSSIIYKNIEINTVDQYQGRDKDIILVSFVRSEEDKIVQVGKEILDDERRLNVAITRAKKKLILVGSMNTLKNYKTFEKLFKILSSKQILNLSLLFK